MIDSVLFMIVSLQNAFVLLTLVIQRSEPCWRESEPGGANLISARVIPPSIPSSVSHFLVIMPTIVRAEVKTTCNREHKSYDKVAGLKTNALKYI